MTERAVAGARPVRGEDAFDVDRLSRWLADCDPRYCGAPEVKQFSGGASNLTYLLRYPDHDLILRRPPTGRKAAGAHDMSREYRIQTALEPTLSFVPRTVGLCEAADVIGTPFYVMERVDGLIPRKEFPVEMPLAPGEVTQLCNRVLDMLVDLHAVDTRSAELDWIGKGDGYVARQVRGWSQRYRQARTWNVPTFEAVMAWLDREQPPDRATSLLHNDFRLDNIVFARDEPTRPIALLDWELATIGDPLMDLGGALAYWIQGDDPWTSRLFRMQPTNASGMLTRDDVVDYYCAARHIGLTEREWAFYEVFGLFRLAAICQQIYYRYHHRQTTNRAFRHYFAAVNILERRCRNAIRPYR